MILDEKPLGNITNADLDALVRESVCESPRLEYKREGWGDNDEGKREMLRDIASFANATGGYIVLGVTTERGQGAGSLECPTAIPGIEPANYQERILRSCRDNLDPICVGIEAHQVASADGRICVVVRVSHSLTAPHMVTFKGLNQFWQRHGTDKQPMTTEEVRSQMLTRMGYQEKLLERAEMRKEAMRQMGGGQPILYVWAASVMPPLEDINVNDLTLRQSLGQSLLASQFPYNCSLYCDTPRPSLHGIEARDDRGHQWLQLFRQGFVEFGTTRFLTDHAGLRPITNLAVTGYLENFADLVTRLVHQGNLQGPIALGCSLLQVMGSKLWVNSRFYFERVSDHAWNETDLDMGHVVTYDWNGERPLLLKRFNDLLWNAFHYDDCPYYRGGHLQLPDR